MCTSVLELIELLSELCSVRGDDDVVASPPSSLRSVDVDDLRTTPTRSLAMRDHDSRRLCVSQQAAGPRPPFIVLSLGVCGVCVYVYPRVVERVVLAGLFALHYYTHCV